MRCIGIAWASSNIGPQVNYIKVTIDGRDVLELDKFSCICHIGSVDYLAEVREALGLT